MQSDFSDTFIKSMLGWIRWIASSIANLFQSGSGHSSGDMSTVTWFADNWIKILIALIVVGVVVDWLVWMARWRPYWVWFRKRRILLNNDVDGIDDDDLMLRYQDMVPSRRGDGLDLDLGDLDDIHPSGRNPDRFDEDEYLDDLDLDVEGGPVGEGGPVASRRRGETDFDELYDDRYGDYAEDGPDEETPEEPEDGGEADVEESPEERVPTRGRAPKQRRPLFKRARKVKDEDPFSVEGDFFDDLGEDPMADIEPPRARTGLERDAQDTSVYERPRLLPGDEPGAVRGADEDEGWHSGYTQRSAERGRRRKQDTGA
jgi:hypothetical protein